MPWPAPGERRRASDGSELALSSRIAALDPLEQVLTLEIRAQQWREGQLVAQEKHALRSCYYFRNEMLAMLNQVGFLDVSVQDGWTGEPGTVDSTVLVFIARKDWHS
jgi:hypothetical protein